MQPTEPNHPGRQSKRQLRRQADLVDPLHCRPWHHITLTKAILLIAAALLVRYLVVRGWAGFAPQLMEKLVATFKMSTQLAVLIVNLGNIFLRDLVVILILVAGLSDRYPRSLRQWSDLLGFNTRNMTKFGVGMSVVAGVVLVCGMANIMITAPQGAGTLVQILPMILVAPIMEEVAFRGGAQNVLRNGLLSKASEKKRIPLEVVAVILQTAVFFGIHCFGGLPKSTFDFVGPIVAGAVCAVLYRFGKSLWVPVIFHIAWNTVLYVQHFANA